MVHSSEVFWWNYDYLETVMSQIRCNYWLCYWRGTLIKHVKVFKVYAIYSHDILSNSNRNNPYRRFQRFNAVSISNNNLNPIRILVLKKSILVFSKNK